MKRDWDLIRKLLIAVEEGKGVVDILPPIPSKPKGSSEVPPHLQGEIDVANAEQNRQLGHIQLLCNSGYINGINISGGGERRFTLTGGSPRLTMQGHDLLATMRDATVWSRIKSAAVSRGVDLSFDVIKALGQGVLAKLLDG